jgi:hypothetical protein
VNRKYLRPLPKPGSNQKQADSFRKTYWTALFYWDKWRKQQQMQKWRRKHNPNGLSWPVFVVGCQRSGTTMLVHNLNRSWEVELFNEDNPKAFHNYELFDLEVVSRLVRQSYAQAVLFKPIVDTYRTHLLLQIFPESKVLFLFRHFDDIVNSMLRTFGDDAKRHVDWWLESDFETFSPFLPTPETQKLIHTLYQPNLNVESVSALYWLLQNRFYFDLNLSQDSRVKLIQYESLVQTPETSFREICDFMEIEFRSSMIKNVRTSSITRYAPPQIDSSIRSACHKLWGCLCTQFEAQLSL